MLVSRCYVHQHRETIITSTHAVPLNWAFLHHQRKATTLAPPAITPATLPPNAGIASPVYSNGSGIRHHLGMLAHATFPANPQYALPRWSLLALQAPQFVTEAVACTLIRSSLLTLPLHMNRTKCMHMQGLPLQCSPIGWKWTENCNT